MAAPTDNKPRFDFDNAGDITQKIKQTEEGIEKASENIEIFNKQVEEQQTLKIVLKQELEKLKLQAKQQGIEVKEN